MGRGDFLDGADGSLSPKSTHPSWHLRTSWCFRNLANNHLKYIKTYVNNPVGASNPEITTFVYRIPDGNFGAFQPQPYPTPCREPLSFWIPAWGLNGVVRVVNFPNFRSVPKETDRSVLFFENEYELWCKFCGEKMASLDASDVKIQYWNHIEISKFGKWNDIPPSRTGMSRDPNFS